MIKAYLAGKYRDPTHEGIQRNIAKARDGAALLWQAGYAVLCPHMNTALFDGVVDDMRFLDGDIAWLRAADVLVLLPGWETSPGTRREIEVAKMMRIPVVTLEDALEIEKVARLIRH